MKIKLFRLWYTQKSTVGELWIDGAFTCFTLEDKVSNLGIKIPGMTAIPKGIYKVIIDYSNRFKKDMPHILNVPGFEGIRIHKGNDSGDTEGCILVGKNKAEDKIWDCAEPFAFIFAKLVTNPDTTIEIVEC